MAVAVGVLGASCTTESGEAPSASSATHQEAVGAIEKKGVAVHRYKETSKQNGERLDALNLSWWYNWGAKPINEYVEGQFVPMVWGANDMNEATLSYLKQGYDEGRFRHLLTFNEPDLRDQANMTVEEALGYWEQLQELGIPLSSPAVSYYDAEKGNEWLDDFMEQAEERGYRVDFIAIHLYQSFYSDGVVQQLKNTLDALYERYGLPVWLTEFGAIDIIARDSLSAQIGANKKPSASCTQKNVDRYVREATNLLERLGYVERYAWFLDNFDQYNGYRPWEAPYTALYEADDALSNTGKTYQEIKSNIPLYLGVTQIPATVVGQAYLQRLTVCGGTGDYVFQARGLPQGLTMAGDGTLSGTVAKKGIFPISVTVSDSGKSGRKQTLTRTYVLTVK